MNFFIRAIFCLIMAAPLSGAAYASDNIIRIQLKPSQEARINSQLSGRISAVHYKDGETVEKGQILINFECNEKKSTLAQTQARVNRQIQLLTATQALFDLGSASETQLGVLRAELDEAKAMKNSANIQVKKCVVKAPFSGHISALFIKNHFSVQEGEPMIELVGTGDMEIEMIIPSKWMQWLKPDTVFNVAIDETNTEYEAAITRLGGRVDPITQSLKAYAKLTKEAPELLAGMSGQALFKVKTPDIELDNGE
jgi:membrane fusion protein (multidrug efflux system)